MPGDLSVHAGNDAVQELDHGNIGAEAAPDAPQLEADIAGTDDDEMLRHLLQGKRARVGDDAAFVDFDARQPRDIGAGGDEDALFRSQRSEEHTSELQSLMRISYAVFCLKNKTQ